MNLELTDKYEILALHRIFFEAKYNSGPGDLDVQSSPIGGAIYERLFDLLIHVSDESEAERWKIWRSLDQHSNRIPDLMQRIRSISTSNWPDSVDTKTDFVVALCSPLIPNDGHIADLIAFGDSIHEAC